MFEQSFAVAGPVTADSSEIRLVNSDPDRRPQYRLGDGVLLRGHSAGQRVLRRIRQNPGEFRDSILYRYAEQIDTDNPDPQWDTLKAVVRSHMSANDCQVPARDELVVHLRMGDLKGYKGDAESFVEFVCRAIQEIESPINSVTLVTAVHFGESVIRNRLTMEELKSQTRLEITRIRSIVTLLSKSVPSVRIFSHADIDTDFCYLANAYHLVLGGGHFSLCAAMISRAEVIVPPWAKTAGSTDARKYLAARRVGPVSTVVENRRTAPGPGGTPTTAILCIARNEHPYVNEWLEYHFGLGFDRIYFVSTDDDFPTVINHLGQNRNLRKMELFHFSSFQRKWQIECYNRFLPFISEDWVLVLDLDEFLYLHEQDSIQAQLEKVDHSVGQLQFPWLLQVSSRYFHDSVADMVSGGEFHLSDHVKSMVRRDAVASLGVHSHHCKGDNILSSGERVPAAARHIRLLRDDDYTRANSFILHLSSRGIQDTLIRILGHRFCNEKNGPLEVKRARSFMVGQGGWENIPNRFLLSKVYESLPRLEAPSISMPPLESATDTGLLRAIFLQHIGNIVDFEAPMIRDMTIALESEFQLMRKLAALDISDLFCLDDYAGYGTQLGYLRKLRQELVAVSGASPRAQ